MKQIKQDFLIPGILVRGSISDLYNCHVATAIRDARNP